MGSHSEQYQPRWCGNCGDGGVICCLLLQRCMLCVVTTVLRGAVGGLFWPCWGGLLRHFGVPDR
jgi:hypothetical protein